MACFLPILSHGKFEDYEDILRSEFLPLTFHHHDCHYSQYGNLAMKFARIHKLVPAKKQASGSVHVDVRGLCALPLAEGCWDWRLCNFTEYLHQNTKKNP